jgi:hypothetical protein
MGLVSPKRSVTLAYLSRYKSKAFALLVCCAVSCAADERPDPLGWLKGWAYSCQAPLQEGQACHEDSDCLLQRATNGTKDIQHCHVVDKVCSPPLEKGEFEIVRLWCRLSEDTPE